MTVRPLYAPALLAFARARAGVGQLEGEGVLHTRVHNPLCGDQVDLWVAAEPAHGPREAAHRTRGCVVCEAAAEWVVQELRHGRAIDDLLAFGDSLVTADGPMVAGDVLQALAEVRRVPTRQACVRLPFDAVRRCFALP